MEILDGRQYFPTNVPIIKPSGENVFEFLIEGRDEIGAFARVAGIFTGHRIDIRSISAGPVKNAKVNYAVFEANIFCDVSKADCSIIQVTDELTKLPFITTVLSADMKNRLFDRFLFPTVLGDTIRVVLFRVTPLLQIERRMIERMGSAGEAIMFEEGKAYSNEAIKLYKEALPNAGPELLLENIKDGLRATGWGVFDIRRVPQGFEVSVFDPFILEESDYKENRFLYGVCAKILENLYGGEYVLSNSKLDTQNKKLIFRLTKK